MAADEKERSRKPEKKKGVFRRGLKRTVKMPIAVKEVFSKMRSQEAEHKGGE